MVHTELLHQRFVIYLLRKIRYSCRMRTHEVHNTQRTTTHLDTSSDTLFQWHSSSYWVAPQFWSVDSWIFILIEYSAHTPCTRRRALTLPTQLQAHYFTISKCRQPSIRFDKVLVAQNSSRSLNYRQTNRVTNNCVLAFQIRLRLVPLFLGCARFARRPARALVNFKILLRFKNTTFYTFRYRPRSRNGPETFWNIFALTYFLFDRYGKARIKIQRTSTNAKASRFE